MIPFLKKNGKVVFLRKYVRLGDNYIYISPSLAFTGCKFFDAAPPLYEENSMWRLTVWG